MDRWYKHPKHGYMLRRQDPTYGFEFVVTALCQNTAEVEEDEKLWENHKNSTKVGMLGSAVCVDEMHRLNHNTEFVRVSAEDVPAHIVRDFEAALV